MNNSPQQSFPFGRTNGGQRWPNGSADHARCVYCGRPAETRDHVPPKCLLEKPFPKNLGTVPSCQECNENFSLNEQYFLVALSQVGFGPKLMSKVDEGGEVDRALKRAPALDDRIVASLKVGEGGAVRFVPEIERMTQIARKIAFGLFIRRYRRLTNLDSFGSVGIYHEKESVPQPIVAAMYNWPGIRRKKWEIVQETVFAFLFAKGRMVSDPPLYCFVDFHGTLLAVVGCPDPRSLPRNRMEVPQRG